jgi:hypothetical protein
MRGLVLGAILCVALGLPANGAEFHSDAKTPSVRPPRLLLGDRRPNAQIASLHGPACRQKHTKMFAANASRAAMIVHFERQLKPANKPDGRSRKLTAPEFHTADGPSDLSGRRAE